VQVQNLVMALPRLERLCLHALILSAHAQVQILMTAP
jgi:hypothetical protein